MDKNIYFCYKCNISYTEISYVITHLKVDHLLTEKYERLKCCINKNCTLTYASFSGLRRHCISKICVPINDFGQTYDSESSEIVNETTNEL